jgi:hypothetical protein
MFTVFKTTKVEYNSFSNYYKLTIPISFRKRTITTFEIRFGNWRFAICWGQQVSIILHTANRLLLFKKKQRLFYIKKSKNKQKQNSSYKNALNL